MIAALICGCKDELWNVAKEFKMGNLSPDIFVLFSQSVVRGDSRKLTQELGRV